MAKFDKEIKNDWNYEIMSLNYTGNCDSEFLICEDFY